MKILYGAGNRIGANFQLVRFLNHTNHQIKIAAHIKSSESLPHVDWTLDALYNKLTPKQTSDVNQLFGHSGVPNINLGQAEILLSEIDDFSPDLVISDAEPIVAHAAQSLSIPLWYCSPLHLLDGVEWSRGQLRYTSLLSATRKFLETLPQAAKTFVYSPLGDLKNRPPLKSGYEWIGPYRFKKLPTELVNKNVAIIPNQKRISSLTKILNCVDSELLLFTEFKDKFSKLQNLDIKDTELYRKLLGECRWFFTTGETSYLADAVYNTVSRVCIAPNLQDPETLLNAIACRLCELGDDLAQVELMDKFSVGEIEKSMQRGGLSIQLNETFNKTLDEKVKELCLNNNCT